MKMQNIRHAQGYFQASTLIYLIYLQRQLTLFQIAQRHWTEWESTDDVNRNCSASSIQGKNIITFPLVVWSAQTLNWAATSLPGTVWRQWLHRPGIFLLLVSWKGENTNINCCRWVIEIDAYIRRLCYKKKNCGNALDSAPGPPGTDSARWQHFPAFSGWVEMPPCVSFGNYTGCGAKSLR